ncbi:hypothetical protein H6781_01220 [Candidatus Nomurabacteria bacterium]|nr:hypothetical protein [Candidatus Nomurabacteria bacterium]MCB9818150.1 hypothetical protein [Candidatus Nomurabacteria bacterium]
MSQKSIILTVVLFALLIVGMFIYAHLKSSELEVVTVTPSQEEEAPVLYPDITRVDAKHFNIDGKHTFVGEIVFPSPCDLLETDAIVMESYPEQVILDFSVINNSDSCVEIPTAQRFKIDVVASENASFKARFMGRDIELNLIPAAEGEFPDDFEIFIKG